jgi:hypothetical protein
LSERGLKGRSGDFLIPQHVAVQPTPPSAEVKEGSGDLRGPKHEQS